MDEEKMREMYEYLEDKLEDEKEESGEEKEEDNQFTYVDKEDMEPLHERYRRLHDLQTEIGSLVIEFERQKENLLDDFQETREGIESYIEKLRDKYDLPEDTDYTLNIPDEPGEQGLFYPEEVEQTDPEEIKEKTGKEPSESNTLEIENG